MGGRGVGSVAPLELEDELLELDELELDELEAVEPSSPPPQATNTILLAKTSTRVLITASPHYPF